jgi:hypothetical protein
MTLDERLEIRVQVAELRKAGKMEESMRLSKSRPMEPWMAAWWKKYVGADSLRASGWNLSDAEAEFGPNWLDK